MYILGISAFYHDSAACLIYKDEIIAAAQEERFTRNKNDSSFPTNAIQFCLNEARIISDEISYVVFYEKPFLKFERLIETYLAFAPKGFKSFSKFMPIWIKDKLFQKRNIIKYLKSTLGNHIIWKNRLLFSEHHLSHAASAFYPSPFKNSAILTLDGVGEWTTTSFALGDGNQIKIFKELHFPHSLGLLYSAFTYYIGFKVNSGEYKLMGLAPYGKPKYEKLIIDNLIKIADDGSFRLDMSYFDFATGLTMTNKKFNKLFGGLPRKPESNLNQKHMDLAASIQTVLEKIIVKLARQISIETGEQNLCLAGGVALNCVINGVLLKEKIFKNIWVQPASGDAGGALGAALATWYIYKKNKRNLNYKNNMMKGSLLGPKFSDKEIEENLKEFNANYKKLTQIEMIQRVASLISEGKAVGWLQGRMEFGPRALGNRSILADPRSPIMQKQLNLKIKKRESFRPFAPSILVEDFEDWFDLKTESPYMLFVSSVKKEKCILNDVEENKLFGLDKLSIQRSLVPAITHVNYSARIQTVSKESNPVYHSLISKFKEITGCPILINTSFNIRGEPIVCTPTDAFKCFINTEIDILVIGNYLLIKTEQDKNIIKKYKIKSNLN